MFDPTIIVAIVLLVIYVGLVMKDMYGATYSPNLNPMEMAELKAMLDRKVRVVLGGNWLDNFVVYTRNNHAILSMFFPTKYNPVQGSERVGILFMTAVASVGFESLKNVIWDSSTIYAKILLVSIPVLIVDFGLNYLATREDKAIVERSKNRDAEWCDEEVNLRRDNLTFLIATRNERAIVNATSTYGNACGGQCGFKFLMFACLVVLCIFGASGVSSGWLSSWLLAFAMWFVYAGPTFHLSYCGEDPFTFTDPDDHGEDLPSVAEIPDMTKEEVVQYINEWATHQCCYGEGGEDIDVISAVGSVTKKIMFDSWSEGRWKESKEDDYHGDHGIGWSDDREEPALWDCDPPRAAAWSEATTATGELPGTARIIECPKCKGSGEIESRNSDGEVEMKRCDRCKGSGKLKKFRICKAFFGVRGQHECLDVSECPVFVVEEHPGKQLESVEKDRDDEDFAELATQCEDVSFQGTLQKFVARHDEIENHGSARINKQKYRIELVPLWEVKYNKDDEVHKFWLIGEGESKGVYWPTKEYSPRCCWCLNCFDCNNFGKPKTCAEMC